MNKSHLFGAMCACLLGISTFAQASLIGDTVTVQTAWVDCAECTPNDGVTDIENILVLEGALELLHYGGFGGDEGWNIDIEASSISATLDKPVTAGGVGFTSAGFNGYEFLDLDWAGQLGIITGFILSTDIVGLDNSRISFGDDNVKINLESLLALDGEFFHIELVTSHIPIPPAIWLFGSGLLGIIGISRRKKIS